MIHDYSTLIIPLYSTEYPMMASNSHFQIHPKVIISTIQETPRRATTPVKARAVFTCPGGNFGAKIFPSNVDVPLGKIKHHLQKTQVC
jgi:hypothetical protein